MPRFIVRLVVGLGIIGVMLVVLLGPSIWTRLHPEEEKSEQAGVVTDAFSIQLFHAMLDTGTENPAIAPLPLTDMLLHLREISAGDTRRELEQLQLSEGADPQASPLPYGCLVAVDRNLPTGSLRTPLVTRLPLKENVPQSLSIFNGMLCRDSNDPNGQVADSTVLNSDTQMLAASAANYAPEWERPFQPADTLREADFYNADGGLPHVDLMRSRAPLRSARAEDGSWEAVALPFKKVQGGTPVFLVAIVPAGNAREFAKALTPAMLSNIRAALGAAALQDTTLEMPAINVNIPTRDIAGLMKLMGIQAAFDAQKADFSPITPQKIKVDALLDKERICLSEGGRRATPDANVDYGEKRISLNKPFIWVVCDLSSPMPPHFIGLMENL